MSYLRALMVDERKSAARVRIVAAMIAVMFAAVAFKGGAVALQADRDTTGVARVFEEMPRRADILDRNGELLATSVEVYSLFADPRAIWDAGEVATQLATVFEDLDVDALTVRLSNRDRAFVWVRRQLTPRQRQAVFDLGLEGLGFRKEARRAYPRGTLAGHVLGYTGIDGNGLAGLEYAHDERLTQSDEPLRLTIDSGVQFALETELAAAAALHNVDGGAGVLIDARSGDVLAMASWPPINPNRAARLSAEDTARLDRAVGAVYELGSVYKPLTVALALDAGVLHPADTFTLAPTMEIRGHTIHDTHAIHGPVNASVIVAQSSNIGTVQISMLAGARRLRDFYDSLGLFARAPVQLAGSAAPLLPQEWDELSSATASYGHGIAVSPLAFASAFAALGNDGEWIAPNLIDDPRAEPRETRRVVAAPTARIVMHMLRQAVTDGTGSRAEVAGYGVAGKTGTAERPIAGGYSETENVSSFAAIFPAHRPQYALLIVLDTPRAPVESGASGVVMSTTAAFTAAPAAGRVIQRVAPLLGVTPRFNTQDSTPASLRSVSETRSSL